MKCPLTLEHQDGEKPWSYYRPGDHLIAVITSGTKISPIMLPFNAAPSSQSNSHREGREFHEDFESYAEDIISVKGRRRCTQKSPLKTKVERNWLLYLGNYHVYALINTLAHALNAAYSSISKRRRKEGEEKLGTQRLQPWQFHPFLKKNEFCNLSHMKLYLDQNGDVTADLNIVSFIVQSREDPVRKQVGSFERQRLIINPDALSQLRLLNKVGETLVSFLCFPKP
ncbi:uncharacterized protein LOC132709248 [Pantherophis guttatus]|uniref:Uncharacterized protein LOC132709248 n=1 Tax=Pantherophis guttatus TaxID=94885 RepID=A0ABM3YQI5_PANGU|nr:uncharacterized protein LOC132709248 [Pantherophis guttatus]